MWIKTAVCAALACLVTTAASAQVGSPYYYGYPETYRPDYRDNYRGRAALAVLPSYEISTIVRSTGLVPSGPAALVGGTYLVRAFDRYGRPVRVALDARYGNILEIRPVAVAQPWTNGPQPYGGRLYPPARAVQPDYDDDDPLPSRVLPNVPGASNEATRPTAPPNHSAAVTPARPPIPRPKPAATPAAAKPKPANPAPAVVPAPAPSESAPSEVAPAKLEATALPPVTPLE